VNDEKWIESENDSNKAENRKRSPPSPWGGSYSAKRKKGTSARIDGWLDVDNSRSSDPIEMVGDTWGLVMAVDCRLGWVGLVVGWWLMVC
jgi:hypothetical protein